MSRILALVGEAFGAGGGIAQYNRDLFTALSELGGHDVHILPRGGPYPAAPPIRVAQERPIFGRRAYATRALARALQTRPDVIFCGHLFMAPLAALLARLTGARLLLQLHGIEAWAAPSASIRRAVSAADLVLCVSRDTRAKLLTWSDLAPERALVLANSVGTAFSPGDRAKARVRWDLDKTPALLSVGRLDSRERYKGQDRVIQALAVLKASGLRPHYLIAGEGDDLARLQAAARDSGVADQVRFLGHVDVADLPDLYRAADLFVLPSTGEGFGIVYLEAMACGTPALGLKAGGAPDALCDGELGTVIKEADLASAIRTLLPAKRPPDLAEQVRRRFGPEAFRARLAEVMKSLGEHPAAKARTAA
jgi:phosphatidyl-myo-inositol dimannoside synthase